MPSMNSRYKRTSVYQHRYSRAGSAIEALITLLIDRVIAGAYDVIFSMRQLERQGLEATNRYTHLIALGDALKYDGKRFASGSNRTILSSLG